jgi:hypothetical protein
MYFPKGTSQEAIAKAVNLKLNAMLMSAKVGVDVEIKEHKTSRSLEQNRFLWSVYDHIVQFSRDTGYMPDNIQLPFLTSELLHSYFKIRFNAKSTTRMSTQEFSEYIDGIQALVCEQSSGEYEPLIVEDNYIEKTGLREAA